uniref:Aminoacyl-tRNA synthetase, class 1a, anticodon-binding n=1 Tax=Tanacetum cinerariifolium TaxID=118510 RepID=A0A6L2J2T6_TANCI|nr:hypothetical protein [Tanacetum cinerariifolium]
MEGVMAQIRPEGAPIQSSDPPLSTGNTVGSGEDKMEHAIELTDPVPQTPYDSPLLGGHTLRSDEGSMTLKELKDLCTTLSQKVLDLEKFKTAQVKEISSLKKKVTKLEQRQSSRISGFYPFRAGTSKRHSLGRRNVSKQGRKNMKSHQKFQDIDDLVDEAFKDADDSTRPIRSITTLQPLPNIDPKDKDLDEEVGTERKRQKEASKAALAELYDEVQAQIDVDHELAAILTHKEQEKYTVKERSKLLAEFFERRKKQLAKERAEAIRSKPSTKAQLRNLMMTYLKHTGSEEDEKKVGSRKKREAGSSSKQKSPKKQKVNDQESVDSDKELKKCLKVVPDDDKAINYETLDVKSPIVDCESQVLGTMEAGDIHVYKLTRLDGSYRYFSPFSRMLEVLDRQDVLDLHKNVIERFPANDLEGYDLILWGDLKTLMKSSKDDEIWRNQQDWKLLSWKLYKTCGVHTLMLDDSLVSINMFIEKRYPLLKEILENMLSWRLEAKTGSTLALDLIKFIKLHIEEK